MSKSYTLSADDVTAVMAALPDAVKTPSSGLAYVDGNLIVPDPLDGLVSAAVTDLPASRRAALLGYAASVRYAKEIAGVTVNGHLYPTDRESQAKFTSAVLLAQIAPSTSFQWKSDDGFVTLDAAGLIAVATAAGQYVQAAYALEASADAQINSGAITTLAQVDAIFAA